MIIVAAIANTAITDTVMMNQVLSDDPGKLEQEEASLFRIKDGFGKMILVNTDTPQHYTENGIRIMSILDFICDKKCLEHN